MYICSFVTSSQLQRCVVAVAANFRFLFLMHFLTQAHVPAAKLGPNKVDLSSLQHTHKYTRSCRRGSCDWENFPLWSQLAQISFRKINSHFHFFKSLTSPLTMSRLSRESVPTLIFDSNTYGVALVASSASDPSFKDREKDAGVQRQHREIYSVMGKMCLCVKTLQFWMYHTWEWSAAYLHKMTHTHSGIPCQLVAVWGQLGHLLQH